MLAATRKVYVASKAKEAYGSVLKLANSPPNLTCLHTWAMGKGPKGSVQTRLCLSNANRISNIYFPNTQQPKP